jgi:ankyrin repeat protein
MAAAANGDLEVMELLLEHHAAPNVMTDKGSALTRAAGGGHLQAVDLLLQAGADVAACEGVTALQVAVSGGFAPVVQKLLQAGAPVDAVDGGGATALHCACSDGCNVLPAGPGRAGPGQQLEIVQLLLSAGASVHTAADGGRDTPLHAAACSGHPGVIGVLLQHQANAQAVTNEGWSPLHLAACASDPRAVAVLLEAGADVAATDAEGRTALHIAAGKGHAQVVLQLLAAGAPINAEGVNGANALDCAVLQRKHAVVQVLLAHTQEPVSQTATEEALFRALRSGQYAVSAQLQLHLLKVMGPAAALDASAALAQIYTHLHDEGCAVDRCAVSMGLLQGWAADRAAVDAAGVASVHQQQDAVAVQAGARELLVMQQAECKAASAAESDVEAVAAAFAAQLRLD